MNDKIKILSLVLIAIISVVIFSIFWELAFGFVLSLISNLF